MGRGRGTGERECAAHFYLVLVLVCCGGIGRGVCRDWKGVCRHLVE